MPLPSARKREVIQANARTTNDSGSPEVQVALLFALQRADRKARYPEIGRTYSAAPPATFGRAGLGLATPAGNKARPLWRLAGNEKTAIVARPQSSLRYH